MTEKSVTGPTRPNAKLTWYELDPMLSVQDIEMPRGARLLSIRQISAVIHEVIVCALIDLEEKELVFRRIASESATSEVPRELLVAPLIGSVNYKFFFDCGERRIPGHTYSSRHVYEK